MHLKPCKIRSTRSSPLSSSRRYLDLLGSQGCNSGRIGGNDRGHARVVSTSLKLFSTCFIDFLSLAVLLRHDSSEGEIAGSRCNTAIYHEASWTKQTSLRLRSFRASTRIFWGGATGFVKLKVATVSARDSRAVFRMDIEF